MISANQLPMWKKAPFIRLIAPVAAGILLQWYLSFSIFAITCCAVSFSLAFFLFRFFPLAIRFRLQAFQGLFLQLLMVVFGLLITWKNEVQNYKNWIGKYYTDSSYLVVNIEEPLTEKTKSLKTEATIEKVINGDKIIPCSGRLLLYFEKDDLANALQYGDKIIIHKPLQHIKNSGNPGAFNYERYAAFQQLFHTVFLKKKDWVLLKDKKVSRFNSFIFSTQQNIIKNLQKNIKGKNELGIAEALLIGYKEDLDKDLVQAYSNTGVVHIIAISGLHLGLIYFTLLALFNRLPFIKQSKITKALLLLLGLWLFSILTGASASVLRSAVMFSCIIIGECFNKKISIYNSLAASAFLLLCYNPYFLWDVGFQLSYLAVLSIVIFQKPIYRLWHVKNKWADKIWQLCTVSLAAQILVFPICIYYFHQFPNLFLITNLVAVPLSSIILYLEIIMIAFSWIPGVSHYGGKIVEWLVCWMNKMVLLINDVPFALWDKISSNVLSTGIMYAIVICMSIWLLKKRNFFFKLTLACLLLYTSLNAFTKWENQKQQKLIVYNIPQHQAIDWVHGSKYYFIGDSILQKDGLLKNFHLKPSRVYLNLTKQIDKIPDFFSKNHFLQSGNKRIILIDKPLIYAPLTTKIEVELIIISKNPKLSISQIAEIINPKIIVFDASNSLRKVEQWKKDCKELHLSCYSVSEKGAFILDID